MTEAESADVVDAITAAWKRELPCVPAESIGIVTRVWHIAKLLGDDRSRLLRSREADMATLDLLSTLRRSGTPYRMTTRELAAASLITAGAITQRVDRAEKQGLVTRSTRENSRTVDVELTELGYVATDDLVAAVLTREHELLSGLTTGQQEQLTATLKTLLEHLLKVLDDRSPLGHVGHNPPASGGLNQPGQP
jgi:DNA-binding MarR family transcriptional regulator